MARVSRWSRSIRWATIPIAATVMVAGGVTAATTLAAAKGAAASPPAITGQPQPATPQFGKTATFRVTVSGSPKPTVQWQVSSGGGAFTDT